MLDFVRILALSYRSTALVSVDVLFVREGEFGFVELARLSAFLHTTYVPEVLLRCALPVTYSNRALSRASRSFYRTAAWRLVNAFQEKQ